MSELEAHGTVTRGTESVLIHHPVAEHPMPCRRQAPRDGPLALGVLGRNVPKKGLHHAIRALSTDAGGGWRLVIAGPACDEQYGRELRILAGSLGVEDRVRWTGYVEEKNEFFALCDVLAMPSDYEAFGMVAAEAMSRGLPVIVPRRSGVAELVDEFGAGFVMEQSDTASLAEALATLDRDRDAWQELGANGIRAVNAELTEAAFAGAMSGLYASVTGSSGGTAADLRDMNDIASTSPAGKYRYLSSKSVETSPITRKASSETVRPSKSA